MCRGPRASRALPGPGRLLQRLHVRALVHALYQCSGKIRMSVAGLRHYFPNRVAPVADAIEWRVCSNRARCALRHEAG